MPYISRRDFLISILAIAANQYCFADARDEDPLIARSLGDVFKKSGIVFGSAFDMEAINDSDYGDLLIRNSKILVTDYNLKFKPLRRQGPDADFQFADRLVNFARAARIPLRGHCLIWNEFNPDWILKSTKFEREYWLDRHISEVMSRYAGLIQSWDVVNEPFWPGHGLPGGFRNGPWMEAMGEGYILRAFKTAAIADPSAKLVLNEAWVERDDRLGRLVRDGLFRLISDLLNSGAKIDAVGLQCHLRPKVSVSFTVLSDFLHKLSSLPIDVYITELDIDDEGLGDNVDEKIAHIYGEFVNCVKQHSNVKMLTAWQLSDKYTFYAQKYKRKVRGLLFDERMKPKIAIQSIMNALAGRKN